MYLEGINDLVLHGVYDRGVPNQERIVLKTQNNINLAPYGLLLTVRQNEGWIPLQDQFFWFGEIFLNPNTWIFVYTGLGITRMTNTMGTEEPAYVLHWNRPSVIFRQKNLEPSLIQIGAIANGQTVVPQIVQSREI